MIRSLQSNLLSACVLVLCSASVMAADLPPAQGRAVMHACKPDVQSQCKGVQSGGGRILACLKQHEDTLSQACKDELKKHMPAAASAAG